MTQVQGCLRYWDQCTVLTIDAAVALWCGVEPSALSELDFATSCMDAKRQILIEALTDKRLEYLEEPVQWSSGGIGRAGSLQELIQKGGVRIKKDSLRRLFEDMPSGDRPGFLFDESRRESLPDGGAQAEMNANIALALMARMLAKNMSAMRHGDKPNAAAIGSAIDALATELLGTQMRGLGSFHRRIGTALNILGEMIKPKPASHWKK